MIRRLFRLIVLAGAAAGVTAVFRALTSKGDPLPAPAAGPTSGPWPPLRNETAGPSSSGDDPAQAVPPPTEAEPAATAVPEGAGAVPIADETTKTAWVESTEDGECPAGYPIKANMKSKIFHSPGQLNYERTTPDRCYADASAAVADGLRAAKR